MFRHDDKRGCFGAIERAACPGVALVCVLGMLCSPAAAQTQNRAAAGLRVAQAICSRCHVVVPGKGAGWTDAPSFEAVANKPATSERWLRNFIQQPHVDMTGQGEAIAHSSDLAAYIMSLRHQ